MSKLWCALVIKDKLTCKPQQIPDVKYCWAEDFDEARNIFANANWPQAFWVEGKSVCRILKLFAVFSDEFYETEEAKNLSERLDIELLRCLPVEQRQDRPIVQRPPEDGQRRRKRNKSSETEAGEPTTQKRRRRKKA